MLTIILVATIVLLIIYILLMHLGRKHADGKIVITKSGETKLYSLELGLAPDEIDNLKYVKFVVAHEEEGLS